MSKATPTAKVAAAATKVEVTPTVARMYFNHEECEHASTPAARAKCRKDGDAAKFRADNGITRLTVVPAQDAAPKKSKKSKVKVEAPTADVLEVVTEAITAANAEEAPIVEAPAKSSKVKKFRAVHSHLGDAVIHWARAVIVDDVTTYVAACGNRLSQPVVVKVTEAKSCVKCRAMTPPIV